MPRRFTPPWSIEERQESFIVKDANGQQLAYLYFEDEPQRQMSMKRLSRDAARPAPADENRPTVAMPGPGHVQWVRGCTYEDTR